MLEISRQRSVFNVKVLLGKDAGVKILRIVGKKL